LKKRGLEPAPVPADADYCMLLERLGIGLTHERLQQDEPMSEEEIIRYLAHSRVTEQRSTEEIALQLKLFGGVPELERALAMIADEEVNHLFYCHEELLRLCARGHRPLIQRMLKQYAYVEIAVFRQVSLRFIDEVGAILGWSPGKRGCSGSASGSSIWSSGSGRGAAWFGWRRLSGRMRWGRCPPGRPPTRRSEPPRAIMFGG
jgi:hypothetical protein